MGNNVYKYKRNKVREVISTNSSNFYKNDFIRLRYKLDVKLAKNEANLTANFILMNPAEADCKQSDNTVTKIINYIFENKNQDDILKNTGRIVITNLYSVYAKDEEELGRYIKKYGSNFAEGNNDIAIYKAIQESDYIVVAWGSGKKVHDYDKRINVIKDIIRKSGKKDVYHIGELINEEYPKHLSRFSYEEKLNKYEL